MKNKTNSWLGFFGSLLFHLGILGVLYYSFKTNDSANGHFAQVYDTNISIEMIMGMIVEEPEPEPIVEPEPEIKEEIPDPTVKPEPVKPKPEKKKEKPKVKPKKKESPKKDLPKGDRTVDSDAKINAAATGPAQNSNNPNLLGNGASSDQISAYISALRREIERNKRYPQRARLMRRQGVATIAFTVNSDGVLSNIHVSKSSGVEDLDNAAMAAVKSARPVGPRPAGMGSAHSVPVRFSLR